MIPPVAGVAYIRTMCVYIARAGMARSVEMLDQSFTVDNGGAVTVLTWHEYASATVVPAVEAATITAASATECECDGVVPQSPNSTWQGPIGNYDPCPSMCGLCMVDDRTWLPTVWPILDVCEVRAGSEAGPVIAGWRYESGALIAPPGGWPSCTDIYVGYRENRVPQGGPMIARRLLCQLRTLLRADDCGTCETPAGWAPDWPTISTKPEAEIPGLYNDPLIAAWLLGHGATGRPAERGGFYIPGVKRARLVR
ncbi:MAG: hypothetical protein ACRCW4_14120 [Candidatus Neomicrothrix subdominans]